MDLFRYFHPHHNPRLRKVALRLQEVGELELAAKELARALKRAQIRVESSPSTITVEQVGQVLAAVDAASEMLTSLIELHPGDTEQDMERMIEERQHISGWENWTTIVRERLSESIILKRSNG
jgi:hypothetical protein